VNGRAVVLMYHNVGMPPKDALLRGLYVTPRMFRFQMWYLKTAGFKVVPLKDILHYMSGDLVEGPLAAITFDDGYQDFYDNAYPALQSCGYPATVFLVSDHIGGENLWDYKDVKTRKKLLGWESIYKLKDKGIEFGSHSKTHPFLSTLSEEEIYREIRGSKAFLEEKLQLPVEFFCYPFGDYDARVRDLVRQSGYLGAITTKRGLIHRGDDPFEMRRSFIRLNTHPLSFIYKLHSRYEDRKGQRI
jgi:peptidoglycan/xylan/chitin deacetylase (PgdA/CDA1 family)